jgi:hypothetical protein
MCNQESIASLMKQWHALPHLSIKPRSSIMGRSSSYGQKSSPKPYFNTFNIAGTEQGTAEASVSKALYELNRQAIANNRQTRLHTAINDCEHINAQSKPRAGYPTKRVPDPARIRKRSIPFANLLNRYKLDVADTDELLVHQLHATRGWRKYA